MRSGIVTIAIAVGLLSAVAGCDLPRAPAAEQVWTLDDYVGWYRTHEGGTDGAPFPIDVGKLLVNAGDDHFRLVVSPTFEEQYPAAYVTTDLWRGFDEIWVQPMYVLVKGFDADGVPSLFPAENPASQPIFTVGPKSRFYSPYWETLYVTVPEDVASTRYRSQRDIVNDATLVITPGPGFTASLLSSSATIDSPPTADSDRYPTPPLPTQMGPVAVRKTGYLDGATIAYLDFGPGGFRWNAERVVEEIPLYDLSFRDSDGRLKSFGGPKIGAAGPFMSGRAPKVRPDNRPLYGAYWRLYNVELPPTARIFAPTQFKAYRDRLMAAGVPTADAPLVKSPTTGEMVAASAGDVQDYLGQIFLDKDCLATLTAMEECQTRLNSASRLETLVPTAAFMRTDVTVTCPFVSYRSQPVPNP